MERAPRTARDMSSTTRGRPSRPQITTRGAPTAREAVEPTKPPGPGPFVVHRSPLSEFARAELKTAIGLWKL